MMKMPVGPRKFFRTVFWLVDLIAFGFFVLFGLVQVLTNLPFQSDEILETVGEFVFIGYLISVPDLLLLAVFNFLHEFDDYDSFVGFLISLAVAPVIMIIHFFRHLSKMRNTEQEYTRSIRRSASPSVKRPPSEQQAAAPQGKPKLDGLGIERRLKKAACKAWHHSDGYLNIECNIDLTYALLWNAIYVTVHANICVDRLAVKNCIGGYDVDEETDKVMENLTEEIKSALDNELSYINNNYDANLNNRYQIKINKSFRYH